MSTNWLPHADGFVCGNVGIFPGFCKTWELWEKVDGEWGEVTPYKAWASLEVAKAQAINIAKELAIGG